METTEHRPSSLIGADEVEFIKAAGTDDSGRFALPSASAVSCSPTAIARSSMHNLESDSGRHLRWFSSARSRLRCCGVTLNAR